MRDWISRRRWRGEAHAGVLSPSQVVSCRMGSAPFAQGAMRYAFRFQLVDKDTGAVVDDRLLAKSYIDGCEREVVFKDAKMQMVCRMWAQEYNR